MAIVKRLLIFYFIFLFVFMLINTVFGSDFFYLLKQPGFYLMFFIVVLPGQFLGFLIDLFNEKPEKKAAIFHYSAIVSCIILSSVYSFYGFKNWKHKRDFGNVELNSAYFKDWPGVDDEFIHYKRKAFALLSEKYVNPNDFRITGSFSQTADTAIDGRMEHLILLRLVYKKKYATGKFKAMFGVVRDSVQLLSYDEPLSRDDRMYFKLMIDSAAGILKDALKKVPGPAAREIKKEFPELPLK